LHYITLAEHNELAKEASTKAAIQQQSIYNRRNNLIFYGLYNFAAKPPDKRRTSQKQIRLIGTLF
jgi:hypothetical protein